VEKEEENKLVNDVELLKEYEKRLFGSEEERLKKLERLREEVVIGFMAGGFLCTIIGIMIGPNGKASYGMDFMDFAKENHKVYAKYKKQYLEGMVKGNLL